MENKVIEWEDWIVGNSRDVADYILKETLNAVLNNKEYSEFLDENLDNLTSDLEFLVNDLKTLNSLDNELVKVTENPMGGYYIVKLGECE